MDIDKQLIHACKAGKEASLSQLYHLCYSELMSVCIRYQRNKTDAESILNEGFIKIVKNLNDLNEDKPFVPWIRRIMINLNIDHFRKDRNYNSHIVLTETMKLNGDAQFILNEADLNLDADELLDMIKALSPMAQKVFNLYALDGYKHDEIAALLQISAGTSKYHLSTARARLQKMISEKPCLTQIKYSDEKMG